MKKVILGLLLALVPAPAFAECTSGYCGVEINCTTGEVTYYDATPIAFTPLPEPIVPTHTISVSTTNQVWGASGTPEQIAQAVYALAPAPITADPCLSGGCTKVEVNATTGVTTISPLSEEDLKQRAKDLVDQSKRQAELAKVAYQALPNITEYVPLTMYDSVTYTAKDETLEPDWWTSWSESFYGFYETYFWWWSL